MKHLIAIAIACFFSLSAHAACGLCQKVDKEIAAWAKADTKDQKQKASKESHALFQRLALGIHSGDKNLIAYTVRLFGAVYAKDFDPLHQELENFMADLKKPEFRQTFMSEMDKLPPGQKEKLMVGLQVRESGPEPDDGPPSE